jgi:hypothetical protein
MDFGLEWVKRLPSNGTALSVVPSCTNIGYNRVRTRPMTINFAFEWLALQLRIREIPGEIRARRPSILTEGLREFPQYLQKNAGTVPQIRPHDRLLPYSLHFIIQ